MLSQDELYRPTLSHVKAISKNRNPHIPIILKNQYEKIRRDSRYSEMFFEIINSGTSTGEKILTFTKYAIGGFIIFPMLIFHIFLIILVWLVITHEEGKRKEFKFEKEFDRLIEKIFKPRH